MDIDARRRSLIYQSLVPVIGDENANAPMSEFPAVEAEELVTTQFLRTELGELRAELSDRLHRQTVTRVGAMVGATALLEALTTLL